MDDEKRTISPLRRLLMSSNLDGLLGFLHQTNVRYVLNRQANGHYEMSIFKDGMLKYRASSGKSCKSAVADCLAQFLTGEQKDFHGYMRSIGDPDSVKVM